MSVLDLDPVVTARPPLVSMPATAEPARVTGTTAELHVLGKPATADGAPGLTYHWEAVAAPAHASPTFDHNNSALAADVTVTFDRCGAYIFMASIRTADGLTTTSTVDLVVAPTPGLICLRPESLTVRPGGREKLTVVVLDQFRQPTPLRHAVEWSVVEGSGTVGPDGTFTAGLPGRSVVKATVAGTSGTAEVIVAGPPEPLRLPWSGCDIGRPAVPGAALPGDDTWAVRGGGGNISGQADQFYFVNRTLAGDGSVIARVTGLEAGNPGAKAGVMIRDGAAPNAAFAQVVLTADRELHFEWRPSTGSQAATTAARGGTIPVWVKLVRHGQQISGYHSADGQVWVPIGAPKRVLLAASARAGLAVTAAARTGAATATFAGVQVCATPQALMAESFENGTARWSVASGDWRIEESAAGRTSVYVKTDRHDGMSLAGGPLWTDYAVEAWVNIEDLAGGVALLGRVRNPEHYDQLSLRLDRHGKPWWWLWQNNDGLWTQIAGGEFDYSPGTWYRLRLTLNGTVMSAAVSTDGTRFTTLGYGTAGEVRAGRIGLRGWGCRCLFDEVVVRTV